MEKISTDIYSFENLRKGGYVYVDKTDLLWRLAAEKEGRQFFISRPRRFGKSLMLSTLKSIFGGRRELFKGLKIEKKRWDWKQTWPVVMLNMADVTASSVEELRIGLIVPGGDLEFPAGAVTNCAAPLVTAQKLAFRAGAKIRVTGADGLVKECVRGIHTLVRTTEPIAALPSVEWTDAAGDTVAMNAAWLVRLGAGGTSIEFAYSRGTMLLLR